MNDPHVVALTYDIDPSLHDNYTDAVARDHDHEAFRVTFNAQQIRFAMTRHYPTDADARQVVDTFIRHWQFHADLTDPCYSFILRAAQVANDPTVHYEPITTDSLVF